MRQYFKFIGQISTKRACLLSIIGCAAFNGLHNSCSAQSSTREQQHNPNTLIEKAVDIKLFRGMNENETANALGLRFSRNSGGFYTQRYPFNNLLPYTNVSCIAEWITRDLGRDGWPTIAFGVFDTPNKTNLVDAFYFKDGIIAPLIDGIYNARIHSLKAGDSVNLLYQQLGKRDCEYFLRTDGRWAVRFVYLTYKGHMFKIDADAATGVIISSQEATL